MRPAHPMADRIEGALTRAAHSVDGGRADVLTVKLFGPGALTDVSRQRLRLIATLCEQTRAAAEEMLAEGGGDGVGSPSDLRPNGR